MSQKYGLQCETGFHSKNIYYQTMVTWSQSKTREWFVCLFVLFFSLPMARITKYYTPSDSISHLHLQWREMHMPSNDEVWISSNFKNIHFPFKIQYSHDEFDSDGIPFRLFGCRQHFLAYRAQFVFNFIYSIQNNYFR